MLKIKAKNRISPDYRFTTDDRNHPVILALKEVAKAHNKNVREQLREGAVWPHLRLQRVVLKGRGPRKAASLRDSNGRSSRMYQQHLRLDDAVTFDVYYAVDTSAQWDLEESIRVKAAKRNAIVASYGGNTDSGTSTKKVVTTVTTTTTTTFE